MERPTAARLATYLGGFKYDIVDEDTMQLGIGEALRQGGIAFEREHRLSRRDRPDFFVDGVAIEVKRKGTLNELLRQLSRYAEHDQVRELLVVTARVQSTSLPTQLHGKPLCCCVLIGSFF